MFCRSYLVLALLAIGVTCQAGERPNIVFAFADDLGCYAGAYADAAHPSPNDVIKTPNFDRVAREGTLFDNAFVSVPSCTPCRASVVSGRHFFRNGSHSQLHHPWVDGVPDPWANVRGWPLTLQDAGYHIGWSYKMHISEDRMGGKKRNYRQAGSAFNRFSQTVSKAKDPQAAKERLLNEVRGNFDAFLGDRTDDQPFYYWFNPTNTHRDWVQGSGKELWGIDPDDLQGKLPSFLPDQPVIREDFADYLGEAMAFDAAVGVLLETLTERGELENTIVVISGDHGAPGFPRGKCNLYDFGTRVPLAIRWPEKMAAGRRISEPVSLIDLGATFLDAVQVPSTEVMDGQSLMPVLSKAAAPTADALRGYVITGRENHVRDSRPGGLPYPMRAIRTSDYLYIINFAADRWPVAEPPLASPIEKGMRKRDGKPARPMDIDYGPTRSFFEEFETSESIAKEWQLGYGKRPAEELYAVIEDPDQVHNLAANPAYEDVRAELRAKLMEELQTGQDPRVVDPQAGFDAPPYAPGDPEMGRVLLRGQ